MVWRPAKALGLLVGLVIVATIIGIDVLLVQGMLHSQIGIDLFFVGLMLFLSLPLLTLWLYWYHDLLTLAYKLDRNALVISCGTYRHVIPMGSIKRILRGSEVQVSREFRGIAWPGYLSGRMRLRGLGTLITLSTETLERQIIVVTGSVCYGISPKDPERFLEDYAVRASLGPIRETRQEVVYGRVMGAPVWRDRPYWAIALLALLANLALFGFILQRYPLLPDRIPLHFNAQSQVDRVAAKGWLLMVPAIGTLTWGCNVVVGSLLHLCERPGAYLFTSVALCVQVLLWLASLDILNLI